MKYVITAAFHINPFHLTIHYNPQNVFAATIIHICWWIIIWLSFLLYYGLAALTVANGTWTPFFEMHKFNWRIQTFQLTFRHLPAESQDSISVSIVTRLWAGQLWSDTWHWQDIFFFSSLSCPDQLWKPPGLQLTGHQGTFHRNKAARLWYWLLTFTWCQN
jgi:hypothetical protein